MGDAFECDKCGTLCRGQPPSGVKYGELEEGLSADDTFLDEEIEELCDSCYKDLKRFMGNKNIVP